MQSIASLSRDDFPLVREFLREVWAPDHPILNQELFEWQYHGYGPRAGLAASKILLVDGRIVGFRGVIPGVYQVWTAAGQQLHPGASLAMWIMDPHFRGRGFGYSLLQATEREFAVLLTLGVNPATAQIYRRNDFTELQALHRYVIPLDLRAYARLLVKDAAGEGLESWMASVMVAIDASHVVVPSSPASEDLHQLWQASTAGVGLLALYRNAEFWRWRYIDTPGFRYLFFGDPSTAGIIVARIEPVHAPQQPAVHGLRVLRLIEVVPRDPRVWSGAGLADMQSQLLGVLRWAITRGCCAADFQISSRRFDRLMLASGFREQEEDYGPPPCGLAGLFQPFRPTPRRINAFWRIVALDGSRLRVDADDTYLVKSDNDMDRPNLWPVSG